MWDLLVRPNRFRSSYRDYIPTDLIDWMTEDVRIRFRKALKGSLVLFLLWALLVFAFSLLI